MRNHWREEKKQSKLARTRDVKSNKDYKRGKNMEADGVTARTTIVVSTPKTEEITQKMDCDACPEKPAARIDFNRAKWEELQFLMKDLRIEFACYLLGTLDGVRPTIDDYYIPTQDASTAAVEITEDILPPEVAGRVIGHLHSHHSMGAFHSGTDNDNMNYPINIVISDKGHVCTTRKRTQCGRFMRNTAEVWLIGSGRPFDIPGRDKITPKTYNNHYTGYNRKLDHMTPINEIDQAYDDWEKGCMTGVGVPDDDVDAEGVPRSILTENPPATAGSVASDGVSEGTVISDSAPKVFQGNLIQQNLCMAP